MSIKSKILSFLGLNKKADDSKKETFQIKSIKEMSPEEKSMLKKQYEKLKDRLSLESVNDRKKEENRVKEINSKCPHCKSKNVNNRIKRLQGEISGSGSGSFSGAGFLGIGSIRGSYSSNIHGSIDTNEVNKCNDCQNEWKVEKASYHSLWFDQLADRVISFLRICHQAQNDVEWNPNDLSQPYKSLEEKRQAEIKKMQESFYGKQVLDYFGQHSLELVKYVVEEEYLNRTYHADYDRKQWEKYSKEPLKSICCIRNLSSSI